MVSIAPQSYRTTPVVTRMEGTLLDAATVTDNIGWVDPEGISHSYNCLTTGFTTAWPCPTEDGGPYEKQFIDTPGYSNGIKSVGYAGVMCKSIGFDPDEAMAEMRRVYESKETVAVEKALMVNLLSANNEQFDGAQDVTPAAGAVDFRHGLGLLEQWAGELYAGTPTIHASRTMGAVMWKRVGLEQRGSTFWTPQGSKFASGVGYGISNRGPDGLPVADPAVEQWVYATGEVSVVRGDLFSHWELDRSTNEIKVLVERPFVAWVDCFVVAVRVRVES